MRVLACVVSMIVVMPCASLGPAWTNVAEPVGTAGRETRDFRLIDVPGSSVRLALWEERTACGRTVPYYAISLDGEQCVCIREASYELGLIHGSFDPLESVPPVEPLLAADADVNVFIVQFLTQPLSVFNRDVTAAGGTVRHFVPQYAYVVEMSEPVRARVAALPYVRWVGPYHPAYRLEPALAARLASAGGVLPPQRYSIQVFERGPGQQHRVADRVAALGGTVHLLSPLGGRMEATLTGEQLRQIVRLDEVTFVDRRGRIQPDMNIVREVTGANYVEAMAGYTGEGVRGEVLDTGGVRATHCDLQSNPLIFHYVNPPGSMHATASVGIVFGDGTCNPAARGMLPDGQGIYADFLFVGDPYVHFAELVDPQGPYRGVFQSRSVGHPRTTTYTTISAEMDDLLFTYDIVVTQSMSNAGAPEARPEAWAKNVVSVGGVLHFDTLTTADDCWCGTASVGPAADGRIKPDLVHFYDDIFTLSGGCDDCYGVVGGTSASTPIVAGCFGLFLQMWAEGIFGNPVCGGDPFDERCHMTTAKAVMINTASPYPFTGLGHDLTRTHQGWGLPNVRNPYDLRDRFFIVDETDTLEPFEVAQYDVTVAPGEPAFKATLVYADPPGLPASAHHRVNDLTLQVTTPSGIVYYGNNGLLEGNWSTPGGSPNTIDTVENVFLENPQPGTWTVAVRADEIVQDGHVETPQLDADFALVVSGIIPRTLGDLNCDGAVNAFDIDPFVLALTDPPTYVLTYPDCDIMLADCNADGVVNAFDIDPFVELLIGP